jgi:hypothetical protein
MVDYGKRFMKEIIYKFRNSPVDAYAVEEGNSKGIKRKISETGDSLILAQRYFFLTRDFYENISSFKDILMNIFRP